MSNPVSYIPDFVSDPDGIFNILWNELNWERRMDAPRREYWTNTLNRPYTYGRGAGERTYSSKPEHALIGTIRQEVATKIGHFLEGCFLNGYEGKRDWLGWHQDDDPGINHNKPIAVITVGEGRNIQYREVLRKSSGKGDKGEYGPVATQMLKPGSVILMHAGMQSTHEHRIPKADFEAKPRISLTYRGLI